MPHRTIKSLPKLEDISHFLNVGHKFKEPVNLLFENEVFYIESVTGEDYLRLDLTMLKNDKYIPSKLYDIIVSEMYTGRDYSYDERCARSALYAYHPQTDRFYVVSNVEVVGELFKLYLERLPNGFHP